jgi:hypothetical protein
MIQSGENDRGYHPNTNCENGILIRSEKVQHDPRIVSVRYDPMHSTIRLAGNTMQYAYIRQTPHSTIWYDTTRYEPRAIGLQCNTYNHVHTIRVFPWGVQYGTMRYNTILTTSDTIQYIPRTVRHDTTQYEPRVIGLQCNANMYGKPRTVHTICGSYCISLGRNRIVLQILTPRSEHVTYGTGCI